MFRKVPLFALTGALALSVAAAGLAAAESLTSTPAMTPGASHILERMATADPEVEAVVDHRKGVMRAVGGHMASLAAILLDGAPYEESLSLHGVALAGLLGDIPGLFPEGTDHEESGADPAVWSNWDTFVSRSQTSADRAEAFRSAVEGGNRQAMVQAFAAMGASCGACHEDFRN